MDYVSKKYRERKKGGEEITEETSEKSKELEGKDQGACTGVGLFAAKVKIIKVVSVIIHVKQTYA